MKIALVVVDPQPAFMPPRLAQAIASHARGTRYDAIAVTRFANSRSCMVFRQTGYGGCFPQSPESKVYECILDLRAPVFTKNGNSVFAARGLKKFLRKNKVKKIVLCGTDTDCCVLASAFAALDNGFFVEVLPKYCASSSGSHKEGMKILKQLNAVVVAREEK